MAAQPEADSQVVVALDQATALMGSGLLLVEVAAGVYILAAVAAVEVEAVAMLLQPLALAVVVEAAEPLEPALAALEGLGSCLSLMLKTLEVSHATRSPASARDSSSGHRYKD